MMIAIVLLSILFLVGFFNTLLYNIPPKKLLAYIQSYLPYLFTATATVMEHKTSTVPAKKTRSCCTGEKTDLERVFATFDKNGDGFITRQELGESLRSIGLFTSEKEVGSMIEKLDINGDGLIDLEEFCEMYESMGKKGGDPEEGVKEEEEVELRDAFDVFDGDKDGLITVEELGTVLNSLGIKKGIKVEECKEMIKKVDMDGDGMVNFDEFKHMMKNCGKVVSVY